LRERREASKQRSKAVAWPEGLGGGGGWEWPEVGDERRNGLHRPIGQLGRCVAFGPGEELGCSGLRWAKRLLRHGPALEFPKKNRDGLLRPLGRTEELNREGLQKLFLNFFRIQKSKDSKYF
jgi:hypothetical protein